MKKEKILKLNVIELKKEYLKIKNNSCSNCSTCSNCSNCSNCPTCFNCSYCSDCSYCFNCSSCSDCSYCFDLKNKKYYILNTEFTKKEYFKFFEKYLER